MPINFQPAKKITAKNKFQISQRELLIIFSALLALAVAWLFPVNAVTESLFSALILLLAFPLLVIKFIIKKPLKDFGLQQGNKKVGMLLAAAAVITFALINYLLIFKFNQRDRLIGSPGISLNFWTFLEYELLASTLSVFSLEFFFRGFLQLGLEKNLGLGALLVPALLNTAIFYKYSWFILLLRLLLFLAAGLITQRSRSIYYSAFALWLIYLLTDIMLIKAIMLTI